MPSQNAVKSFLAAFLVTIAIAVGALVIALAASTSGTSTDGIGAYAGGVSQRFVNLLALALVLVFLALFFMFHRTLK